MLACVAVPADAGLPRGAMLVADEQDADADTGVTIARGNAEISIEKQRIVGRADSIELRPATKDIVFKGRARVTVGSDTYTRAEVVTCTSDFSRCANGAASDPTSRCDARQRKHTAIRDSAGRTAGSRSGCAAAVGARGRRGGDQSAIDVERVVGQFDCQDARRIDRAGNWMAPIGTGLKPERA